MIALILSLSLICTPVEARVTAYAPLDNQSGICAQGDPTKTSIGRMPGPDVISVDPKVIPYGSLVFIPGHGYAVAVDTGGALRRYDGVAIDIYKDTYKDAIQWGEKYMTIYVYERRLE